MTLTSLLQVNPHLQNCLNDPGVIANAYRFVSFFDLPEEYVPTAEVIAASVYDHLARGHSCLPLTRLQEDIWFSGHINTENNPTQTSDHHDTSALQEKMYPGVIIANLPYFDEALSALTTASAPYHLVIEFDAIYMRSYQSLETKIAELLIEKNQVSCTSSSGNSDAVQHKLTTILPLLFPEGVINNAQALAVGNACHRMFSIINGGPGTGKTYTAARVLLALKFLSPQAKIALAAPTGKAAQRLGESIDAALEVFNYHPVLGESAQHIPKTPTTVHRLIGTGGHSKHAKYHRQNPLPFDVIMVDEVSMLDLRMTEMLLLACKPKARVIWLGDSAQLPSVDVGCVLEDLVGTIAKQTALSRSKVTADWLTALTGTCISESSKPDYDHVITLTKNYRSLNHINDMANAILAGEYSAFHQAYNSAEKISSSFVELEKMVNENQALQWHASDYTASVGQLIKQLASQYFAKIAQQNTISEALSLLQGLKILTPMRRGKLGVEDINSLVISTLDAKASVLEPWFKGLPIIVLQNDHVTRLNNGDVGIVWPNDKGELVAFFPVNDGQYRVIHRYRLPVFEPVYAMTVHKSQGSEFANVVLVLPEQHNELCHKELLFTGVTRARSHLMLAAHKPVLEKTLITSQKRDSYLSQRIFGGA